MDDPGPIPLPPAPPPADRRLLAWRTALWPPGFYLRGHLFVHAIAFMAVAWHMATYPERYTPDTWRGLLFIVTWANPRVWAGIFVVVALGKLAGGIFYPKLAMVALLGGVVILCWWTVGLAFAAFTPGPTEMQATIIPAVLAALALGEHFAAITLLDGRRRWRDSFGGG